MNNTNVVKRTYPELTAAAIKLNTPEVVAAFENDENVVATLLLFDNEKIFRYLNRLTGYTADDVAIVYTTDTIRVMRAVATLIDIEYTTAAAIGNIDSIWGLFGLGGDDDVDLGSDLLLLADILEAAS